MRKKPIKSIYFTFIFTIFTIITMAIFSGCQLKSSQPVSRTAFYLDTVITVTLYDVTPSDGEKLLEDCMALVESYENLLSKTVEGSDVWNINHSAGAPVAVHEDTACLLSTALTYAKQYNGMVDPSIGTLSGLWDFGDTGEHLVPAPEEIARALSHVSYENISLNGNQVTLTDPETRIDLGFIAKGYIADRLKEFLLSQDVSSAIINLGGNVLTIGTKPDGTPFQVGIQKPFDSRGATALVLTVSDSSVVSSGNYERYFELDHVLYHHILSTRDGYPVDSGLSQVTILSENSVDGDALSTLCFILGYEKGYALIESLPHVDAVFITQDGTIYQTW